MKIHLAFIIVLAAAACSTAGPPTPDAPATVAAAPRVAGPISLVGKWAGSITCYSIDLPLQMSLDAVRPRDALMSKGDGSVVTWPATVAVNDAARFVTITAAGAADGAERIAGALSADGATISGAMDKQLCTKFMLTRTR